MDFVGLWKDAPPHLPAVVEIVERRGCDRSPIDPLSVEGRLALEASVGADQTDRLARLRGAIEVAARIPAEIDQAPLEEWLPARLDWPRAGVATVVFHI